ncbi:TetR/AcrR family transcriptional regulator [Corynebacterium glyciniphilum]|uniref:TetR/AcrR family transcriptional regulator n=1 Tax=Corynebacterium glyciniphilum TaxID=1404244 RepID=UPI003DA11593
MTDTNPLAESLRLLWDGLPEREKGPRRSLTLAQVVTAAVELADDAGVDALSMRALAQKLGVGTMSLYRYVPSKTELLNLMLDSVVGPTPSREQARHQGWRTFLTTTAHEARRMYLAHPWTLQANWSRPVLGPNSLADLELFMSGVRDLPLSDREKMNLTTSLDSYIHGAVRQELLYTNSAALTGISDEEFWRHQGATLARAMESGQYPTTASVAEDAFDADWEENFTFGLELLLDGTATLIGRQGSR